MYAHIMKQYGKLMADRNIVCNQMHNSLVYRVNKRLRIAELRKGYFLTRSQKSLFCSLVYAHKIFMWVVAKRSFERTGHCGANALDCVLSGGFL